MDTTTYLALRDDFLKALHQRQLLDALHALKGQISWLGDASDLEQHAQISQDYQAFLHDFRQGLGAEERTARFNRLIAATFHLGNCVHHRFTMAHTHQYRAKLWQQLSDYRTQQSLVDTLRYESNDKVLFDMLFTAAPWTTAEVEAADELMAHPNRTSATRLTAISAVTLYLLACFDSVQLTWLLRQASTTVDNAQRVRVLVGLVFVAIHQARSIALFPELQTALSQLFHSEHFAQDFRFIQGTLLASTQTRDFSSESKSLFSGLTEMVSLRKPELKKDLFQGMLNLMAERFVDGMAGIDIALSGFKQVYGRYPFFKEAANWFIPFSTKRPELQHLADANFYVPPMEHRAMGNTDLYVKGELFIARKQLLEELNTLLAEKGVDADQEKPSAADDTSDEPRIISLELTNDNTEVFKAIRESVDAEQVEEELVPNNKELRLLNMDYNAYIHDCYRFFLLFAGRNEGDNPFRDNLLLRDYSVFHGVFDEETTLAKLGQLAFAIKDYAHAFHFFQLLPQHHRDVRLRLAQCHHALQHYAEAIPLLEQLVESEDDESLLELLAGCYEMEQRREDALVCWIRLAQLRPDDLTLSEQMVDRYLTMQLYSDALDEIHKILYHKPDDLYALSAKAKCYLCLGNFLEAHKLYDALLQSHPESPMILLYAGHCTLLSGDTALAVRLYMAALEQEELREVPADYFDHALERLSAVGFTSQLATFLRDTLNSELRAAH